MRFGDALKDLFNAYFEDRKTETGYYNPENLRKIIGVLGFKNKRACRDFFSILTFELEKSLKECKHLKTSITYDVEICQTCNCYRTKEETEDVGFFSGPKWTDWKI